MKIYHFLIIVLVGTSLIPSGCAGKKTSSDTTQNNLSAKDSTSQNLASADTSQKIVLHWMCPNNCKGSGGTGPGICPVCGSAYQEPLMYIDPVTHMATPTHKEAQNARGDYHFICPKGCPGGAGVAGNCKTCGTPLEHNQAFHYN